MKKPIRAGVAAAMLGAAPADAETICQRIGNATFCDNGLSSQKIGNTTFYNNGVTRQDVGNTSFYNWTAWRSRRSVASALIPAAALRRRAGEPWLRATDWPTPSHVPGWIYGALPDRHRLPASAACDARTHPS
jgi:hypothetical protein